MTLADETQASLLTFPLAENSSKRLYVIVLNYILPESTVLLLDRASFVIVADGGANRLYHELPRLLPYEEPDSVRARYTPDVICGDLDSLDDEIKDFYIRLGVPLLDLSEDQMSTDLMKCISFLDNKFNLTGRGDDLLDSFNVELSSHVPMQRPDGSYIVTTDVSRLPRRDFWASASTSSGRQGPPRPSNDTSRNPEKRVSSPEDDGGASASSPPDAGHRLSQLSGDAESGTDPWEGVEASALEESYDIVALGALGGRLDHCVSNLSVLHIFHRANLVLWGDGNVARLAGPGRSVILSDRRFQGPTCGLLPLAGPAIASTQGLMYDMNHVHMRIGGLISSSNVLTSDKVLVETDAPLLWTTELREAELVKALGGARGAREFLGARRRCGAPGEGKRGEGRSP